MDNPNLNKHNPLPFLQQAGLEEVEDFHPLLDLKGWAQYHRWLLRLISEQQDVVFAALTKARSWEEMKKLEKEKHLSEDDTKRSIDEVQKITDSFIKRVDEIVSHKDAEVMEV